MIWELKLAGAGIVVVSFAYAGYLISSFENKKIRQTEAFVNLIRHIKSEISCYKTPVSEIISAYSNKELEECGFFQAFEFSWNDALHRCEGKLYVDSDVKKLLEGFGNELGKSYKDEQIMCCDYYLEKLEALLAKEKSEAPKKHNLYRSCSIMLGLFAVIILL